MDIKEEVARVLVQEEIKKEIEKLKSPPQSTRAKIWDVLNSHFGGWLLGTSLVTLITVGLSSYSDCRGEGYRQKLEANTQKELATNREIHEKELAKTRDDSEFLIKMLPQLTDRNNFEMRCQAVSVLAFRHLEFNIYSTCSAGNDNASLGWSDQKMCLGLKEITNTVIRNYSDYKKIQAAVVDKNGQYLPEDKTCQDLIDKFDSGGLNPNIKKTIVKDDDGWPKLNNNPDKSEESQALAKSLPVRVYIQIFSENDKVTATNLQNVLRAKNILVPGIENVGDKNGAQAASLQKSIVRYYEANEGDKTSAEKVMKITNSIVGTDKFSLQPIKGDVSKAANKGTIEVWFRTPQP
jgi:hypothetical protein